MIARLLLSCSRLESRLLSRLRLILVRLSDPLLRHQLLLHRLLLHWRRAISRSVLWLCNWLTNCNLRLLISWSSSLVLRLRLHRLLRCVILLRPLLVLRGRILSGLLVLAVARSLGTSELLGWLTPRLLRNSRVLHRNLLCVADSRRACRATTVQRVLVYHDAFHDEFIRDATSARTA